MNLKLETEFSKAPILQEVDALKKQIDDMRPLLEDLEGRVMQKLRLDWNYHSNAIEGNKLNYGETVAFLMEGITAKGKPLKDHLDIRGHNEAINFLLSIVKDARPISESEIRSLHKMILVEPYEVDARTADGLATRKRINLGEYKTSANHVKTTTGEMHYYASPEETPAKMQELMEWYSKVNNNAEVHPIVAAALFHHKFVSIHPFDDGNGRLSRILMNLILMQKGYPPVVVKMDDRMNYYSLLSRADNGDGWAFVVYIIETLCRSLQLYLKAAAGGDIHEDEDIDKEIALFKMDILNNTNVKEKRTNELVTKVLLETMNPVVDRLKEKAFQFKDLFFESSFGIYINPKNGFEYSSVNDFVKSGKGRNKKIIETLYKMGFVFTFKNFRNAQNDFDLEIWVAIEFEDYFYEIYDDEQTIVKKQYHEKISIEDERNIVTRFVNKLKVAISEKLTKSPESN